MCRLNQRQFGQSTIASNVLAYLAEHPQAQDTVDGIMQWWLSEQIKWSKAEIQAAIDELIADGLLLEHGAADGQVRYGLRACLQT